MKKMLWTRHIIAVAIVIQRLLSSFLSKHRYLPNYRIMSMNVANTEKS